MTDETTYAYYPTIQVSPAATDAQLAQGISRTQDASNGVLSDWRVGSPSTALLQGFWFGLLELYWYMDNLPSAIALEVFRLSGVVRSPGTQATGYINFLLTAPLSTTFTLPAGYLIPYTPSNYVAPSGAVVTPGFVTQQQLVIPPGLVEGTVLAQATDVGYDFNIAAFSLTTSLSLAYVQNIYNSAPFSGGTPLETLDALCARAQNILRTRNVLVSISDYEQAAQAVMGQGSRAFCVPLLSADQSTLAPGQVTLYCADATGSPASQALCTQVQQTLTPDIFAASSLWVNPVPTFLVRVDAVVQVTTIDNSIVNNIANALNAYLNPTNWSLGKTMQLYEVQYVIRGCQGVNGVSQVLLNQVGLDVVMPTSYTIPAWGSLNVNMVQPDGTSSLVYSSVTGADINTFLDLD